MTKLENEIIYKALVEYENRHYESEDEKWQVTINKLIDVYSKNEKRKELEESKLALQLSKNVRLMEENNRLKQQNRKLEAKIQKVKNFLE